MYAPSRMNKATALLAGGVLAVTGLAATSTAPSSASMTPTQAPSALAAKGGSQG